ncbi:hypothetical protein J7L68_09990 [bacterium]|nr:hypothetical protein [bacterium]
MTTRLSEKSPLKRAEGLKRAERLYCCTDSIFDCVKFIIIIHYKKEIGAQVIFCLEWEVSLDKTDEIELIKLEKPRRHKMAEERGIPRSAIENLALLELCNKKDDDPNTPAEYKFLAPEKTALVDSLNTVTTLFQLWHTRSDEYGELTAKWEPLEKQAKDLIGRARNLWSMRFEEGNVYERTAGIDNTPRKKEHIARALDRIVIVSNDNAGTPGGEVVMGEWSSGTLAELSPALLTALQILFTEARDNLRDTALAIGEHRGVSFIPPHNRGV